MLSIVGPTAAQFNFGGFQGERGGGFGGGWFGDPFQQHAPRPRRQTLPPAREEFSKAPPPEKRETIPEHQVLVLGDAMADWLAYGLEEAYSEQPEMGVIRKAKSPSGLIKYQPKGDPADWVAAAKGILATEKADAIVVMLGLDDRVAIREPVPEKTDGKSSDKGPTARTPKPNRMARLRRRNPPRSPMLSESRKTSRQILNYRRKMAPTLMRRSSPRRKARARRTGSMSFAKSVGSNCTQRKSKR